jgi:hypothetical protein
MYFETNALHTPVTVQIPRKLGEEVTACDKISLSELKKRHLRLNFRSKLIL